MEVYKVKWRSKTKLIERILKYVLIKILMPIIIIDSFLKVELNSINELYIISIFAIFYYFISIYIAKKIYKEEEYIFTVYTAITVIAIPLITKMDIFVDIMAYALLFTVWYRIFLYSHGMKIIGKMKVINNLNIATIIGVTLMVAKNIFDIGYNFNLSFIYQINNFVFYAYLLFMLLNINYDNVRLKNIFLMSIKKYVIFLPIVLIISYFVVILLKIPISFMYFILLINLIPPASVLVSGMKVQNKDDMVFSYILMFIIYKIIFLII